MNVKWQIWFDRYLIRYVVFVLDFFVRIVGKILRPDHNLNKSFKKIAIAKYKGMGSILHATPLLQTLRQHYPDAEIHFVSTQANKSFLDLLPFIDKTVLINDGSGLSFLFGFPKLIWQLIKNRYDVFIDLEIYAHMSSLITTLSMARNRLGFHLQWGRYRHGTFTHLIYFNHKAPLSRIYLQMASLLGTQKHVTASYNFKDIPELTEVLKNEFGLESKYIVINPNASSLRLERRWPLESFEQLIKQLLLKYPDHKIALIGSPSEYEYTASLYSKLNSDRVINLAGKSSLKQLISILKSAEFMISNDTGPFHMSVACGKPSIGLYGPVSPRQFELPTNAKALYKNVFCSPCVHEFDTPPCQGNNVCMQLILVEDVMRALETLNQDLPQSMAPIIYLEKENALGVIKRS